MELIKDAILSGIENDLGSGSNIDLCIITASNTEFKRGYYVSSEACQKMQSYKFPVGTTGTP